MRVADVLLLDFDPEVDRTRRTLERVPEDKPDWAPHEKSMPLGRLAVHLATLPLFAVSILSTPELDLSTAKFPNMVFEGREKLLTTFEETSSQARQLLATLSDQQLEQIWAMRFGDRVIAQAPRAGIYRGMFLNHMVHHRAQVGVYLRLLGIPVPAIYGPSADDRMGF
jgi:uncharacterized damage-inducible protein DinB